MMILLKVSVSVRIAAPAALCTGILAVWKTWRFW